MWKSSQKTLRDAIVYQFLDIAGTLIKEFVNRKHPEAMLRNKILLVIKIFPICMFMVRLFVSLCPYYCNIWGKCKDLQRRGKIYHVFCLGDTIAVKVTKHSSARKIFHECYLCDLDTEDVQKV